MHDGEHEHVYDDATGDGYLCPVAGCWFNDEAAGEPEQQHVCQDPSYGPCPRPECGAVWR